jgi:hypothetical protein
LEPPVAHGNLVATARSDLCWLVAVASAQILTLLTHQGMVEAGSTTFLAAAVAVETTMLRTTSPRFKPGPAVTQAPFLSTAQVTQVLREPPAPMVVLITRRLELEGRLVFPIEPQT